MKRNQASDEPIIGVLKEAKAGVMVTELFQRNGMSGTVHCAWKAKFGGLKFSDAKRLRALENGLAGVASSGTK